MNEDFKNKKVRITFRTLDDVKLMDIDVPFEFIDIRMVQIIKKEPDDLQ